MVIQSLATTLHLIFMVMFNAFQYVILSFVMLTFLLSWFLDLTECQRRARESGRQPSVGAYIPQCTPDGEYIPRQCHGSTGHCWCVNEDGEELVGSRRGPGQGDVVCDAIGKYLLM